jgi:NTE family protein
VTERALVLGGGGAAGNAWEIGVVAGLFAAGVDVTGADLIIGTSAGATAAAQLSSGTPPDELLAAIVDAAAPVGGAGRGPGSGRRPGAGASLGGLLEKTSAIIAAASDPADMRRRLGAAALAMDAGPDDSVQARRRAIVAARLPS